MKKIKATIAIMLTPLFLSSCLVPPSSSSNSSSSSSLSSSTGPSYVYDGFYDKKVTTTSMTDPDTGKQKKVTIFEYKNETVLLSFYVHFSFGIKDETGKVTTDYGSVDSQGYYTIDFGVNLYTVTAPYGDEANWEATYLLEAIPFGEEVPSD